MAAIAAAFFIAALCWGIQVRDERLENRAHRQQVANDFLHRSASAALRTGNAALAFAFDTGATVSKHQEAERVAEAARLAQEAADRQAAIDAQQAILDAAAADTVALDTAVGKMVAEAENDYARYIQANYPGYADKFISVITCESHFDPNADNGICKGIAQFNPSTYYGGLHYAGDPEKVCGSHCAEGDIWNGYYQIDAMYRMFGAGRGNEWVCQ
jgi:hypothetical protein